MAMKFFKKFKIFENFAAREKRRWRSNFLKILKKPLHRSKKAFKSLKSVRCRGLSAGFCCGPVHLEKKPPRKLGLSFN